MKSIKSSIKAKLLLVSILPALIIGIVLLIVGVRDIKSGMEEEVLKGLLASAYAYKDIGINVTEREAGDSAIETALKNNTGYDYTWFEGDTRKNSSLGSSVIGTQAASTVIQGVIGNKKTFTSTNTTVAGQEYFVAYVPVITDGKTTAMAFTGVPRHSVNEQINKLVVTMIAITVVILVIATIIVFVVINGITRALVLINKSIDELANGRFVKADKYLDRTDEIGVALNDTNKVIDKLSEIVSNIKESAASVGESSSELSDMANQISQTAEDVSNAVQEIASGATQQADEIQNASMNVGMIGEAVGDVQSSSGSLTNLAGKMKEASEISNKSLGMLQDSSSEMTAKIDEISNTIQQTQDAVNSISGKVQDITSIATQTNLLSLNASIEAARAGEAGKGFSVVAEEIGKLAEDSKKMADGIRAEMESLLEQSKAAVTAANEVRKGNEDQQLALGETIEAINGMLGDINSTVDGVNTISDGANQCETSKNAVVDVMSALSAISEENAASSQETGASMQELSATVTTLAGSASSLKDIADHLNENISFFQD